MVKEFDRGGRGGRDGAPFDRSRGTNRGFGDRGRGDRGRGRPARGRGGAGFGPKKVIVQPFKHEGVFLLKGDKDAIVTRSFFPGEGFKSCKLECRELTKEFDFTVGTFQHVLEGYKVADAIASIGAAARCCTACPIRSPTASTCAAPCRAAPMAWTQAR